MTMKRSKPTVAAPDDRAISIKEAAVIVGVNRVMLNRWWNAGRMPAPRVAGGRKIFLRSELLNWLTTLPRVRTNAHATTDEVTV